MKAINCGYHNHDFKPIGEMYEKVDGLYRYKYTEFECSKCGISTSWEVSE